MDSSSIVCMADTIIASGAAETPRLDTISWFDDSYDKTENKHSGKFKGRLRVEELDIGPETTFDSIRGELQKAGYEITEYPDVISAKKGGITIFTLDATNRIQRVETWCGS